MIRSRHLMRDHYPGEWCDFLRYLWVAASTGNPIYLIRIVRKNGTLTGYKVNRP